MEIILALLALEAGLLRERVFVSLVVMALATSLISGPTMKWMLRGVDEENLAALLRRGAWLKDLNAASAIEAIEQLVGSLGAELGDLGARATRAVVEREAIAPTGLGDEVAVPHAVIAGLARPMLALGFAPTGVDFNAADGAPAKLVFLLLMPPRAHDQSLDGVTRCVRRHTCTHTFTATRRPARTVDTARISVVCTCRPRTHRGQRRVAGEVDRD